MKLNRRTFLGSAAAATTLFPWLSAHGAPARKLLLFFTPHGTIWNDWRPVGGETDFTLSPILMPLSAHRARLVIIEGLGVPHGTSYYIPHTYTMPTLWTGSPIDTTSKLFTRSDHMQSFGWGTGTSVDQAIATQLALATPYKTIELGTNCGGLHPSARMIYSGPGAVKNPIDDPTRAFTTLLGTAPMSDAALATRMARRKSVLDTVLADMQSRKAKLSAADRTRLDAHATAVRTLEQRLQTQGPACVSPGAPTGVNTETAMDRQMDIVTAALGCGLTQIASLQMQKADTDSTLYPWIGVTTGHHELSHTNTPAADAIRSKLYNWYAKRFAYLLDRMAATPDAGGGSILDNTLVIWGSELGAGYSHDATNVPFVLAGGPGVGLRGGRSLKVTRSAANTNHRLLVTALHAMGLTTVQKYGNLDKGTGPVPGVLG